MTKVFLLKVRDQDDEECAIIGVFSSVIKGQECIKILYPNARQDDSQYSETGIDFVVDHDFIPACRSYKTYVFLVKYELDFYEAPV